MDEAITEDGERSKEEKEGVDSMIMIIIIIIYLLKSTEQEDAHMINMIKILYCFLILSLKRTADYDNKVDIYALGLLFVEIFCPFRTEHERVEAFARMRCDEDASRRRPAVRPAITLPERFTSEFPRQVTCTDTWM